MKRRQIRPAVPADAADISRIHVEGWQQAYRGILPDAILDGLDVAERTATRREHLEHPRHPETRNWVVVEDGRIQGFAVTGQTRDDDLGNATNELFAIYVAPNHLGEGFGQALMRHCLDDATERGYSAMAMWVLNGNERAQRFYLAAGFQPDERVPVRPFDDTAASSLRMWQRLQPD